MTEFNLFKNNGAKGHLVTVSDGALKIVNEFDQFPADPEAIKHAKTPNFFKISKIREAIYVSEGVCSLWPYKEWRNTLYRSGYAESLVQKTSNVF